MTPTKSAELNSPPVELSAQPLSPATFWGGDGASGTLGAIEAAKAAMKNSSDTSSEDRVMPAKIIMSKKERRKKSKVRITATSAATHAPQTEGSQKVINPNETRRVTSAPAIRIPTPAGSVNVQNRNASGASIATIEVQVPGFGALGFGAVWEMVLVPFEASKMWIRTHPRVMTLSWSILERGWDMGQIMTITGSRLWGVVFVYSKTGRLRLKRGDSVGTFVFDCVRSAVYLLIFMGLGVYMMRILACLVGVLRVGVVVLNGVLWMAKKLLGQGLL